MTSRHDHRTLRLDLVYFPKGGGFATRHRTTSHPSADLTVTLATAGSADSNQWIFTLPGSAFTARPGKGTGRIATGSKISPYGAMRLTVAPVGKLHTTNVCAEERETSRAVKLTGRLLFNTGPRAQNTLGKVGSSRHKFSLRGDITARYDKANDDPKCQLPPDQPCPTAVTVQYYGPTQSDGKSVGFTAFPHGKYDAISGWRNTTLSKPAGAQRIDEVTTRADTMSITPQAEGSSVTVTANGAGAAGSATLNAPSAPTPYAADYCKQRSTENSYSATVAPDPSLSFHEKLGGAFAIPNADSSAVFFTYQRG